MDRKEKSADKLRGERRKGTLQAEPLSSEEFQALVKAWAERSRRQLEADPEGPFEPPPDLGDPYLERLLSKTWPSSEEESDAFVKAIYEGRGKDVSKFRNGRLQQD